MKTENNDILWTTAHGRFFTLDNLMLRGRSLENWCCVCRCNGESVDHLLLHCPIVPSLQWVMPGSVARLFCWHHWLGNHIQIFRI